MLGKVQPFEKFPGKGQRSGWQLLQDLVRQEENFVCHFADKWVEWKKCHWRSEKRETGSQHAGKLLGQARRDSNESSRLGPVMGGQMDFGNNGITTPVDQVGIDYDISFLRLSPPSRM